MHCSYKEEAGVKSNNTIRMYIVQSTCKEWSCILDSWGSFIVYRADVSSLIRSKSGSSIRVSTRVVESESLKSGKVLKTGKIGKIGLDFLLDLLAKMPKCHKIQKCLHLGSGSCNRILQIVQLFLHNDKLPQEAHTHTFRWKTIQLQPVYLFLYTKGSHINTFRGEVFQLWSVQLLMQPCW